MSIVVKTLTHKHRPLFC